MKPTEKLIKDYTTTIPTTPTAFSAYDLPNIEALVRYVHAASGFQVKHTWIREIKKGNFASWPGMTYSNAEKYCPQAVETIKGNMQGVQSTKKKTHQSRGIKKEPSKSTPEKEYEREDIPPPLKTKGLHICDQPTSKIYTDDCGQFHIACRS